ncbi:ROK family transcriptional regulator [Kutzneria viridogrisea]|uniref:NBD/HSP70 family sugar kinase n=1 Tax=Kutzneria viridogrisea TaxID=47990 RepID=A0ABR6BR33_9PSEU|nr:putative NBD/HSP70 family sugar kinase [Kutzneria viridogrisea]
MRTGTNLPRVGGFNRAVVLDTIRSLGEVSRVELAERTGLTPQTVSNIVRRLIGEGLVAEAGTARSTGGKPRVLLRVVPSAYYAAGVHIDPERLTGVVLDLAGGVVARSQWHAQDSSPGAVVGTMGRLLTQLLRRAGVPRARVLGLGVAAPGPLDAQRRRLIMPPNLDGWTDVALADVLEQRTRLPVVIDNDATAAAIGERWVGGAAGSFLYVYCGAGIGGGLVLADQVHRGTTGNAGELGHVTVQPGGRLCFCGKHGCLEAYCSMRAIVAQARADRGLEGPAESVAGEYEVLCRAAAKGADYEVRLLTEAARRIGAVLGDVVNLLDVDTVVLGGPALRHVGELVRDEAERVLRERVFARAVLSPTVRPSAIGEDAGAIGAASLVLEGAYSPRLATLLGTEINSYPPMNIPRHSQGGVPGTSLPPHPDS